MLGAAGIGADPALLAAAVEAAREQVFAAASDEQILSASRLRVLLWLAGIMAICTLAIVSVSVREVSTRTAATMGWTTFVFAQIFNVFNARSERASAFGPGLFTNRALWCSVTGVVVAQIAIVRVDWLRRFFDAARLDGTQFLICVAVASTVLWLEESRKTFVRRRDIRLGHDADASVTITHDGVARADAGSE